MLQNADVWCGKAQNEVTWLFDHVIIRDHLSNWKHNIFSSARFMTTKFGRVVTYGDRKPPMDSYDPLTSQSWRLREKLKT